MNPFGLITKNPLIMAGVVVGGIAAVWIATKGFKDVGASIGGGAVDLASGLLSGATTGIGGLFGLPLTDTTRGNAAVAKGNWLDASLYLPAQQFIPAAVGAASNAVVNAANNPSINPLQPVGAWLGGAIYNLTHPGA